MRPDGGRNNEQQQVKRNKGKGGIIIAVLVVLLLGVSAFAAWQFFFRDDGEARPEPVEPLMTSRPMNFTVNLADAQQRRFLKVTVELGYRGDDLIAEINKKTPEFRDFIIELFRSRTVAEINDTAGTNALRAEIKSELNQRLDSGGIEEVYFTEFIIQ